MPDIRDYDYRENRGDVIKIKLPKEEVLTGRDKEIERERIIREIGEVRDRVIELETKRQRLEAELATINVAMGL